jgi:hypothetical protein
MASRGGSAAVADVRASVATSPPRVKCSRSLTHAYRKKGRKKDGKRHKHAQKRDQYSPPPSLPLSRCVLVYPEARRDNVYVAV